MTPEEIQKLRNARGETIRQFADTMGVDKNTILNWEKGRTIPKGLYLRTLERMAKRAGAK